MVKHLMLKFEFLFIIILIILTSGCKQSSVNTRGAIPGENLNDLPPQSGEDSWHFIENLKASFADPMSRLKTAYEDLHCFFAAGDISGEKEEYIIETVASPDLEGETFRLEIGPNLCRILAGDIEGIRRGIFYIEDEMLRQGGIFYHWEQSNEHLLMNYPGAEPRGIL